MYWDRFSQVNQNYDFSLFTDDQLDCKADIVSDKKPIGLAVDEHLKRINRDKRIDIIKD